MSGFKYIKTLFQASMIVCAMALGVSGHTYAQSAPVQFEADQVESNQETGTLIATGNVVLVQEGAELRADRLDYDRKTESAVATGHVIYKTADGAIHMTDYLDLSDNFKMIFAEPLISDLSDGSRFTAEVAEGEISTKIEMTSSRFTPCDCDFEAGESPIWDLRATKTTHNKETATIIHENVRMHIFGVPVFYLPVLAHPDASVNAVQASLRHQLSIRLHKALLSQHLIIKHLARLQISHCAPIYSNTVVRPFTQYTDKELIIQTLLLIYMQQMLRPIKKNESLLALSISSTTHKWEMIGRLMRASFAPHKIHL